jgi:hypothetical protein
MNFNSETIVGDYENGNLYAFDLDVYADDNNTQKWLRSWRPIPENQNNLNRSAQHTLQLTCESGVGVDLGVTSDPTIAFFATSNVSNATVNNIVTNSGDYLIFSMTTIPSGTADGQGANPEAMLRWSDDGGHTWSSEHWTQMGRIGQYGFRAFWRRLGMTLKLRDRVYELSGTDPVKIVITGANLLVSPTSR